MWHVEKRVKEIIKLLIARVNGEGYVTLTPLGCNAQTPRGPEGGLGSIDRVDGQGAARPIYGRNTS